VARLYLRKVLLDIIPAAGATRRIEDLRVKFKCEKNNESHPNSCELQIFNLSDKSRTLLEAKNTRVNLQVGYEKTVETVFLGDVTKVVHERKEADVITKVTLADGDNHFRNARLDKGYPPGIKTKDIFSDLANALGLPLGPQQGIPDSSYANGLTLSGLVRDHLNNLCKKNNLEWSIQDETLQIIPEGESIIETEIFLSPDTGLVGFPAKTAKGVEFTSLIQPKLRPGRKVKIDSRTLKGTFKIRKMVHEGDSHQEDFLSKGEATR